MPPKLPHALDLELEPSEALEEVRDFPRPPLGEEHPRRKEPPV